MKKKGLYNEKILELWKNPKNFGKMENPTHKYSEENIVCGDDMTLYLKVEDEIIKDASFFSTGCLICIVFASKLTEMIKGMNVQDVYSLKKEDFLKLLDVEINPLKMRCACLPLDAVQNCLKKGKIKS